MNTPLSRLLPGVVLVTVSALLSGCLAIGIGSKVTTSAAVAGVPAPDFELSDLNGRIVSLRDLRGSPVILNFWATW